MALNVKILENKLLSDHWFVLRKLVFSLQRKDGTPLQQMREVYDRGNGATILLYNSLKNTLVLIRQFRMPTYINGNPSGMLLETCAGLLDDDSPEECIRREAVEETGYSVGKVEKLFSAYMSPGGVTEVVHFFAAEYDESSRDNQGGGIEDEDIEVVELVFGEALAMVQDGRIRDGKTIMLLQHAQLKGWLKA
ncbi:GDP-mannose pyrophosphatase NudK [Sodalis sp. dw_96]|uniref:GDP-mannose pyrophosphatase NudK n=1 Tax=Sodalis sp. dw_96 TaxID=2719794 RepID=UPI001BD47C1F|nr:GDP-mannose pyrophosphatase NudK [Sodalis sp. dw_96]